MLLPTPHADLVLDATGALSHHNVVVKERLEVASSRMHVMNHNWSATKPCLHPQSVAEISCHLVLSGKLSHSLQQ